MKIPWPLICISLILLVGAIVPGQSQDNSTKWLNFNNGIGVVAPDSSFSLNFQFWMQNRVDFKTWTKKTDNPAEFSARIRRFRLRFNGFLLNPRLTYKIQLALAPGNVSGATLGQAPRLMYDAMIYYQFDDHFKLGFGQTVVSASRQRMNSGSALQFVDRSLVNSIFNLDLDFGLHADYKIDPDAERPVILHGAVTTGEGRNWVVVEEPGLSYTGRLDWYPLGTFIKNSAYLEGDLEWHSQPRLMAGIAYNYNDRAQRTGGQRGGLLYRDRDIKTVMADFILKYQGWSLLGDFIIRDSDDPVNSSPAGIQGYIYNGSGLNIQGSRYFSSNWEIVGKYTNALPSGDIENLAAEQTEWALGVNKYIRGRKVKLQSDLTLHQSSMNNVDFTDQIGVRFQAQIGL